MLRKFALAILLTSAAGIASANVSGVSCTTHWFLGIFPYEVCTNAPPPKSVAAPEIDAASAVAGLSLMLGALAVLRGRRSNIAKT
jgi:hypothetical protein